VSVRAFAARIGVNRHTLSHWIWRLGRRTGRGADTGGDGDRFVELVAPLGHSAAEARAGLSSASIEAELVLRDGIRVRVPLPGDDDGAKRVAAFVAALEAR
jgi:transposase-like protein